MEEFDRFPTRAVLWFFRQLLKGSGFYTTHDRVQVLNKMMWGGAKGILPPDTYGLLRTL